jgi:DNA-binding response OmpR family regulator
MNGMPGHQPRILIVYDDEENIGTRLAASLWLLGFRVEIAENAECGQITQVFHPDLVILEMLLRGTDGFEVAQRLRAGGRAVSVLLLSSALRIGDRAGSQLGPETFVASPFDLDEVVLRVQEILRCEDVAAHTEERILRYADLELDEIPPPRRRRTR